MELTPEQLRIYNGKGDAPSYISYDKIVYDVTPIFPGGEHKSCLAGNDLTGILEYMPHGTDVLKQFKIVGKLIDS